MQHSEQDAFDKDTATGARLIRKCQFYGCKHDWNAAYFAGRKNTLLMVITGPGLTMTNTLTECEGFGERLVKACTKLGLPDIGPTRLQREFNLRSKTPVTAHATRKWLVGESIPTQQKLRTLSRWLEVSPEWLRFGDESVDLEERPSPYGLLATEARMLANFRDLNGSHQLIISELIVLLKKTQFEHL